MNLKENSVKIIPQEKEKTKLDIIQSLDPDLAEYAFVDKWPELTKKYFNKLNDIDLRDYLIRYGFGVRGVTLTCFKISKRNGM